MQLPRGTFRSIQKNIRMEELLRELRSTLFTGSCIISSGHSTITLVLEKGICTLAELDRLQGRPAWEKIRELEGDEVSAELSDLSETQLQLALEFNRPAAVERSAVEESLSSRRSPVKSEKHQEVLRWTALERPSLLSRRQEVEKPALSEEEPAREEFKKENSGDTSLQDPDGVASLSRDLDTLDTMDLEKMSEKIRHSCMATVRKLHLGHLIEEKQ